MSVAPPGWDVLPGLPGGRTGAIQYLGRHSAACWRILTRDTPAPSPGLSRAAALLERPGAAARALAALDDFAARGGAASWIQAVLRAMAHLERGDWERAREAAGRAVSLEPAAAYGYGLRSQARRGLKDWDGAAADYHAARDRDPDCAGFDVALEDRQGRAGGVRAETFQGTRRLEILDRMLRRRPAEALLYAERADVYRETALGRFDLALADLRRAAALDPQRAWIAAFLGRAEAVSVDAAAGLRRLDRAAALRPQAGWIRAWRGEARRRLAMPEAALQDLDAAIALDPWYSYAHAWKGVLLAAARIWDGARRCLDDALALGPSFPTDALAFHARGRVRLAQGDAAGAVEDVTEAFQRDGKYVWAAAVEDLDAGLRVIADLSARQPSTWTWAWTGHTLLQRQDWAPAHRALSEAVACDPANPWAQAWRAQAALRLGRTLDARRDLERALALCPGLWAAAEPLADLMLEAGDAAGALRVLDGCGGCAETRAAFHARRARALSRAGRTPEAAEACRRALLLDRGYDEARSLLEALGAAAA